MNTKLCKKCGETKQLDEFTKCSRNSDGLYYQCKDCKKDRIYIPEEPSKYRERYQRAYKKDREKYKARTKRWRDSNPDKVREMQQRYIESGLNKIHTQQRRARVRELPNTFNNHEWHNALVHFSSSCAYCGNSERELQMEHFIPLSKGGHFTSYNIIPACYICNSSKQDKDYFEWYPQQEYFSKYRLEHILAWLDYHVLRNDVKLSETIIDGLKTEV